MRSATGLFITIFIISLIYAILRYVIFGGVEWIHVPLYVINKAVALSGFILLLLSSLSTWFRSRKFLFASIITLNKELIGIGSFLFILGHVFISLIILDPVYFDKFFNEGKSMNLTGELSMLLGIIGLVFMWLTNRYFSFGGTHDKPDPNRYRFKRLIHWGVITSTLHIVVMGYKSWITPESWYGYLPPITLLAFIAFLIWLAIMIRSGASRKSVDI